MAKNTISFRRKKKMRSTAREVDKQGDAFCVVREGGQIIEKTLLPPRPPDPLLDAFLSSIKS